MRLHFSVQCSFCHSFLCQNPQIWPQLAWCNPRENFPKLKKFNTKFDNFRFPESLVPYGGDQFFQEKNRSHKTKKKEEKIVQRHFPIYLKYLQMVHFSDCLMRTWTRNESQKSTSWNETKHKRITEKKKRYKNKNHLHRHREPFTDKK